MSPDSPKSPLPHNIDPGALLDRLTDPNIPIIEIARELGVTVAQVLDAAEHPIITSILSRMDRLDRRRARRAATAAAPAAIQTLDLLTLDRGAAPETRRKAATRILAITTPTTKRRGSPPLPRQGRAGERGISHGGTGVPPVCAPRTPNLRLRERSDISQPLPPTPGTRLCESRDSPPLPSEGVVDPRPADRVKGPHQAAAHQPANASPLHRQGRAGERGDCNQRAQQQQQHHHQQQPPRLAQAITQPNRFNTTAPPPQIISRTPPSSSIP